MYRCEQFKIERPEFDAVAASLKSRDPRVAAPPAATGPILLTGLAALSASSGINPLWNRPSPGYRSRLTAFANVYRSGAPRRAKTRTMSTL